MEALILYTRKNNENADTAMDPMAVWEGQVDLKATGTFCANAGWDMLVECPLYAVRKVQLPDWLTAQEWLDNYIAWRYCWGTPDFDRAWPESWQRGLKSMAFADRYAACALLKVKKFRSEFRKSLRDQLVAWLETPAADRRYHSPFSARQWEAIASRRPWEVKHAEAEIYRSRGEMGELVEVR